MSETKFTPGKWVVRQTVIHGNAYGGLWVEPEDPEQSVQITGSGGAKSYTSRIVDIQDHDDNDANAHLIAAAPDLYAALETLDKYLDFDADWTACGCFPEPDSIMDAMKFAKVALSKARGETK